LHPCESCYWTQKQYEHNLDCVFCYNKNDLGSETVEMTVIRAGLTKCGAQLEALLWGPTQCRVQKFLEGHQFIMIEIGDVNERGPKVRCQAKGPGDVPRSFTFPAEISTDISEASNKSKILHSIPPSLVR